MADRSLLSAAGPAPPVAVRADDAAKVARESGVNLIGAGGGAVLRLLFFLVAARIMGVAEFGIFMLGFTLLRVVSAVSTAGVDQGLVRFLSRFLAVGAESSPGQALRTSTRAVALLNLLLLPVLGGGAWFIAPHLDGPDHLALVLVLCVASLLPTSLGTLWVGAARGYKSLTERALALDLFEPLVRLTVLVALAERMPTAVGGAIAVLVAAMGMMGVSGWLLRRRSDEALLWGAGCGWAGFSPLLRFSLPLGAVTGMNLLMFQSGVFLLGALRTTEEVGVFGSALRVSMLLGMVLAAVTMILQPFVAELVEVDELDRLGGLYRLSSRWAMTLSLPGAAALIMLSPEVLGAFGAEFVVGGLALTVLVASQVVNAVIGPASQVLAMAGRSTMVARNSAVGLVVATGLGVLMVARWGVEGAAYAYLLGMVLINGLAVFQVRALFGIVPFDAGMWRPLTFTLVLVGAVVALRSIGAVGGVGAGVTWIGLFLVAYPLILLRSGVQPEERVLLDRVGARLRRVVGS